MDERVWLITGCSSGFGAAFAAAAHERGDRVVATARRMAALDEIDADLKLSLDVTDAGQRAEAVGEAEGRFGRIDVLVNNAGRGYVGALEETSEEDLRELFEVHVFGPIELTRLVLPGMRSRASGAIVQVSSFGGAVALAGFGNYCGTKFALEGVSEALAAEVKPLGIRVVIVQPGAFRTGFGAGALTRAPSLEAYAESTAPTRQAVEGMDGSQPGDPAKAARAVIAALDAERPPLRLALGDDAIDALLDAYRRRSDEIRCWERVGRDTSITA